MSSALSQPGLAAEIFHIAALPITRIDQALVRQRTAFVSPLSSGEQESTIKNNMGGTDGGDPGPFFCANACSAATAGVGPFSNRTVVLPYSEHQNAVAAAQSAGGSESTYTGKKDDKGNPIPTTNNTISPPSPMTEQVMKNSPYQ